MSDAPTAAAAPPRTLAEELAARSDDALALLLRDRPDLMRPLPEDFAGLAARCVFPPSLRLAWWRLTLLEQQVVETLLALPHPASAAELALAMDPTADQPAIDAVEGALGRCRDLALVWGPDSALRAVSGLSGLVGAAPCGLDPVDRADVPDIARYCAAPATLFDELATAPDGVRAALDRLVWGPPRGTVPDADRPVSAVSARTPVEWLLARRLLIPTGPDSVALPREIALLLRQGRYLRSVALPPGPPIDPDAAPIADVDATAGMNALQSTRLAVRLLAVVDEGNTRALRSGGVYQRDAAELSRRLQVDLPTTALLVETMAAAGLLAVDEQRGVWGLTRTADAWRVLPEPRQWSALLIAWRDHPPAEPLVAVPGTGDRAPSEALAAPGLAEFRQLALRIAASAPAGQPLVGAALSVSVSWHQPRLGGGDLPRAVDALLAQAEFLGLLGRAAPSEAGRLLADPAAEPSALAEAVHWPPLVARVVVQADLTATSLGPMTPESQARLERLADLESAGAAAVYRFSNATLQRAFDAGMGTGEVLAELAALSATGVPAALESLVADVGRRHGTIRVAATSTVVTSDDDAALSAALADRSLQHLRLHRLAAGVAVSPLSADEVAAALRKAGLPALGTSDAAPAPRRLPGPRPVVAEYPDAQERAVAVRGLRAGAAARASLAGPRPVAPVGPQELVAILSDAARDQASVWIDFADATGTRRVRSVQPLTLRAGVLSAYDTRDRRVAAFPLSRIAGIARAAEE
jgi:hypothetical protein